MKPEKYETDPVDDIVKCLQSANMYADPYSLYKTLVQEYPIFYPPQTDVWFISGHKLLCECLNHPDISAKRVDMIATKMKGEERKSIQPIIDCLAKWFFFKDPPEQLPMRKYANRALSKNFPSSSGGSIQSKHIDYLIPKLGELRR